MISLHLLNEKDDATYWFKRLLGDILTELGVQDYEIINADDLSPDDRMVITVESETTYDRQVMSRGLSDTFINEYRIFTIRIYGGDRNPSGVDESHVNARRLADTLNQIMTNTSFSHHHIEQMTRTSAPKRMSNSTNGYSVYDMRVRAWFRKQKEN